ncbi:MAG: PEGA domain-containing protein, partial [Deltaproteobacteria bacterium]|nr:PEGA domain-containing protein [Deltaproteobacteria bacterium]
GQLTPATLKNIEAGKGQSISVIKKGYEGWSRKSVIVASGETTRLVASLKKEPEEVVNPPPPPPPPPPSGGLAILQVSSDPVGADVYVNSEYKGTTPATITDVPTSAKLVVTKAGYLKFIQQLNLKAGETRSLGTVKLEDLFGELSLNSTPPQASIYIDGELIGVKTPVTIKKVPRDSKHSVKLVLEGYQPWESVVDLKEQPTKMYNVTLEKE